jgi:flagellar FliL protein
MADKKPEGGEGDAPPKKKGKLLLFIIIGVLVLVLGGGGAFFVLKKKSHADDEDTGDEPTSKTDHAKKAKKDHPDAPPVFVKLEPFTVKLQTEQQDAYLQATPELRVLDAPIGDKVKQYTPEIRHRVLLLMSGKKASELSSPQGVQALSNEIRVAINVIIDGPKAKTKGKEAEDASAPPGDTADPDDSVQAVLFTSFIIQ